MAYFLRSKKQAYQRRWDKQKQNRWRAVGSCVACGLPTDINVWTGRPFARCFTHRVEGALAQDRYRQKHGLGKYRLKKIA